MTLPLALASLLLKCSPSLRSGGEQDERAVLRCTSPYQPEKGATPSPLVPRARVSTSLLDKCPEVGAIGGETSTVSTYHGSER